MASGLAGGGCCVLDTGCSVYSVRLGGMHETRAVILCRDRLVVADGRGYRGTPEMSWIRSRVQFVPAEDINLDIASPAPRSGLNESKKDGSWANHYSASIVQHDVQHRVCVRLRT